MLFDAFLDILKWASRAKKSTSLRVYQLQYVPKKDLKSVVAAQLTRALINVPQLAILIVF